MTKPVLLIAAAILTHLALAPRAYALNGDAALSVPHPAGVDCPFAARSDQDPIDVRSFGAVGDGVADDTDAIRRAIAVGADRTVYFSPGSYRHDDVIVVDARNVVLTGQDAALVAGRPQRGAVVLKGDGASIERLTITADEPGDRGKSDEESGLVVAGSGNEVVGVTVSKTKSAGILLMGAKQALIACNTVIDTKSDGIHATDGTTTSVIRRNVVRNSGDDGIAMVSYHGRDAVSDLLIEDNRVENVRWGRGISVIGSTQATIQRNIVSGVAMAAGIIVAREASFDTPGAKNVIIRENKIENIQKRLLPAQGVARTGHAAIEVNSDSYAPSLAVSGVAIRDNTILESGYSGIRVLGNVLDTDITQNIIDGVNDPAIVVMSGNARPVRDCDGNRNDGRETSCEFYR